MVSKRYLELGGEDSLDGGGDDVRVTSVRILGTSDFGAVNRDIAYIMVTLPAIHSHTIPYNCTIPYGSLLNNFLRPST